VFNSPDGGVPKGQGTKRRSNIAENFTRLSSAHERYRRRKTDRRQTDGRRHIANEREREFTFAKTTSKCGNMDALQLEATRRHDCDDSHSTLL